MATITRFRVTMRSGLRLAIVATLATTFIAVAPASGAAGAPPRPNGPSARWSPCFRDVAAEYASFLPPEFGLPTFECGTVPVPLDHDRPNGPTISISLVRLPALDRSQRMGSMFVNPGGPGGSGVEFAVFGAPFLYSSDLRSRFDIVGFDPRGIGRSTALKCFGNLDQAFAIFQSGVAGFPTNATEATAWFGDDQRLADACAQRGNKVLGHMSTADVARDLDILRAAVGDPKLTYAGYSYGSYLGVTYANLFPDRVRALIVDGVLDPVAWSTGVVGNQLPFSTRLGSDIGAQDTLEEFFRLCDGAGDRCSFAPESSARFETLAARLLSDGPIMIAIEVEPGVFVEFPFGYGDLIGMSLGAMYDSFSWPFFAADLAFVEAAMAGVVTAPPPGFDVGGSGALGYTSKRGFPRYTNVLEGFPAVACADSDNPDTIDAWIAAAGEISFDAYFKPLWTYASSSCLAFPAGGEDRYVGPFTARTAAPVLVMSTRFDPATPLHGALAVDALLPNSELLVVEGWGHTTLGLSACASFYSERYLITQGLPPAGLVCRQDFDPFAPFEGGAATSQLMQRMDARRILSRP